MILFDWRQGQQLQRWTGHTRDVTKVGIFFMIMHELYLEVQRLHLVTYIRIIIMNYRTENADVLEVKENTLLSNFILNGNMCPLC